MLNDLSDFTRLSVALQTLGPGITLGGLLGMSTSETSLGLGVAAGGIVVMLGWAVVFTLVTRRFDRQLRADIERGAAEILDGAVTPVEAVGRVVRRRLARPSRSFLAGAGVGAAPSVMVVLTALGHGTPRRVAALVPTQMGLHLRKQPARLLLHPTLREVAVVDDRVSSEELAAVRADPRWATERIPTDRDVAGGWLVLALLAFAGFGLGFSVTWLLVTLASRAAAG